ncbi:MAG: flagellar brake protein, partial [Zoogloea sp.]|nr:flagellar brake protein [Zoogloea sp.]
MHDSPTLKFELLQADDYSQYLLRDRREILAILRALIQKRALITAYVEGSNDSFLTALLEISQNERQILLDTSSQEETNRRAEAAPRLVCTTQLDKVKIQFAILGVERVPHGKHTAFMAGLPDSLLRLQRREYFRMLAPIVDSLTCHIPVKGKDGKVQTFEARVVDISGGGIAVMVPPDGLELAPEMEFVDCRLMLPEIGPITAKLRVRNIFRIGGSNNVPHLRAGCEFMNLQGNASSAIMRYIMKVERARNAREK